jgi:hypothetical protein
MNLNTGHALNQNANNLSSPSEVWMAGSDAGRGNVIGHRAPRAGGHRLETMASRTRRRLTLEAGAALSQCDRVNLIIVSNWIDAPISMSSTIYIITSNYHRMI